MPSREALSDSKSLSHILKNKMLTSQLSSTAAQDALAALAPTDISNLNQFGGVRATAPRGKSMNAFNTRRQMVNRSRVEHAYLESFVENVIVTGHHEISQSNPYTKGHSMMNKTTHGHPFAKKSIFKDPNRLIFTNSSGQRGEELHPLSGSRSVIEHLAPEDGALAGRNRRDGRRRQITQTASQANNDLTSPAGNLVMSPTDHYNNK